jgi:hypothetical protein
MIGKVVLLEDSISIYVTLTVKDKGQVAIGIRVNGSDQCIMADGVTMPQMGSSQTWRKNIGDLI